MTGGEVGGWGGGGRGGGRPAGERGGGGDGQKGEIEGSIDDDCMILMLDDTAPATSQTSDRSESRSLGAGGEDAVPVLYGVPEAFGDIISCGEVQIVVDEEAGEEGGASGEVQVEGKGVGRAGGLGEGIVGMARAIQAAWHAASRLS